MNPTRHTLIAVAAGVALVAPGSYHHASAEGMDVTGYAQAYCTYTKAIDPKPENSYSSFTVQEVDLIFQKDLGANFSTLCSVYVSFVRINLLRLRTCGKEYHS